MTTRIYQVGGTLDPDRHYYIPRKADDQLLQLCLRGEYAYVFNASQTGKSSLIERTRRELKQRGIHAIRIDLQGVGRDSDSDRWYHNVAYMIAGELKLGTDFEVWWTAQVSLTPTYRWVMFFEQVVLTGVAEPVVIFIDEIDRTRSLPFRDDLFGALRLMYNERSARPELRRLSFVLAGLATPRELLGDSTQTGHNIWKGVALGDLTEEKGAVDALADGLGLETAEARQQALGWILAWTSGHPYLTQKLCARVQEQAWAGCQSQDIDRLVGEEFLSGENEDNNLSYVERELTKDRNDGVTRNAVLAEYERVLMDGKVRDTNTIVQAELKLTGVVKVEDRWLRVRNRIYKEVFGKAWLKRRFHPSWREWWAVQPKMVKNSLVSVLILILALAGITARAVLSAQIARTRELAAQSQAAGEQLPQLRLLLALEASKVMHHLAVSQVVEAEQALRDAISNPLGTPLTGHSEEIVDVELSLDGHWLATGSKDDTVQVWDLHNIEKGLSVLEGHSDDITLLAFSPDSRWLASGSRDKTIRVWDIRNRKLDRVLESHVVDNRSLLFSPDGHWLLSDSSNQNDPTLLWNLQDPNTETILLAGTTEFEDVSGFVFSPNGSWLIAQDYWGEVALLWTTADLEADPLELKLPFFSGLSHFVFSGDGKFLAILNNENGVDLWDLSKSSAKLINSYQPDGDLTAGVLDLDNGFSPDGQWLLGGAGKEKSLLWNIRDPEFQPKFYKGIASFSSDGHWFYLVTKENDNSVLKIRNIDALDQDPVKVLQPVEEFGNFIVFSPSGRWVVAEGPDRIFRVWDLESLESSPEILFGERPDYVMFSPEERWLIGETFTFGHHFVSVWDMNDLSKQPIVLRGHDGGQSIALSADGRWLVTNNSYTIRLWDTAGWVNLFDDNRIGIELFDSAIFSPNGKWLLTHDGKGLINDDPRQIFVWDTTNPTTPPEKLPYDSILGLDPVTFSQDGRWLLAAESRKKEIVIWEWQRRAIGPVARIKDNATESETIDALAMSQDGAWFAAADYSVVSIWKWDARTLTASLEYTIDEEYSVGSLAFTPDGKWLLIAQSNGTILARNLENREAQPRQLVGHERDAIFMTFSSDGQFLATASIDRTIRLWNNTSESKVLPGVNAPFSSVTLGAGGWLVAGYGDTDTALVWNLNSPDRRPIILRGKDGDFAALSVSDDARWLKTGGEYGNVRTWDLSLEGIIEVACNLVGRNFTQEEWSQYFPDEPYRKTCEQWPEAQ